MSKTPLHVYEKIQKLEIPDGEEGVLYGYASTFGTINKYGSRFLRGAYTKSIQEKGKWPFLWRHDFDHIIGQVTEAREDEYGLWCKFELNLEIEKAREVYSNIKKGIIEGLSVGVFILQDRFNKSLDCIDNLEARLFEISATPMPADEMAAVKVIHEAFEADRETVETIVRRVCEELQKAPTEFDRFIATLEQEVSDTEEELAKLFGSETNEQPEEDGTFFTALLEQAVDPIEEPEHHSLFDVLTHSDKEKTDE